MSPIAGWTGATAPAFGPDAVAEAAHRIRETAYVVSDAASGALGLAFDGSLVAIDEPASWPVLGVLPPLFPEWLGDRSFTEAHGTRFPYVAGAMANGIATTRLVIEMARSGCLGFFGAGGLGYAKVEAAIDELVAELGHDNLPWGSNLIHSPNEPALEEAVADLYITRGVRKVSAAAYMSLTPAIVRYAYSGITVDAAGVVHRKNMVFAKVSRPEVARHFMNPAPARMLEALVNEAKLTADEARLGRKPAGRRGLHDRE